MSVCECTLCVCVYVNARCVMSMSVCECTLCVCVSLSLPVPDTHGQAYHQGLLGPRYVWLLMGGFKLDSWWRDARGTNCTAPQLAAAVSGCFAVVSLNTLLGGIKSVANLVS